MCNIDFSLIHLCSSFEYDGTSNRWKNVRPPVTGSIVTAVGSFKDTLSGTPILNLLDISYGSNESTTPSPTRTVGYRGTQRQAF